MYPYGIIGNCQSSALVDTQANVNWYCLPRPDSPPIFGQLLDPDGGHFKISSPVQKPVSQKYVENTNVLETTFADSSGNAFKVTDFAPRFQQYGRIYRPTTLVRIVEILSGSPQIVTECRPVNGWSKAALTPRRGNSHLQFPGLHDELRLTTNLPLCCLIESIPYTPSGKLYFALTFGLPMEDDLGSVCESFLLKTITYWHSWVKLCSVPSEFQKETIRSALALKLHCFEETGAILAAITTSLPETVGSVRNWDYRYCWLRDACFTVASFYKLGHSEELEGLLRFLTNILNRHSDQRLQPVYKLDGTLPLPESEHTEWTGYGSSRPVREGNQAAEHVQNDVYGEILLMLAPLYFDERFSDMRNPQYDVIFKRLATLAWMTLSEKDAGLWEHRDGWKTHSFTLLMSWAGLDRYAKLLETGRLSGDIATVQKWRGDALKALLDVAKDQIIGNSPDDPSPDAALLLLPVLRFPNAEICAKTVRHLHEQLGIAEADQSDPAFLLRYRRNDGFGEPTSAFLICSHWLVEALSRLGEPERAKAILHRTLAAANHVGLFAEHFDPKSGTQTGNFPQCYSHVGQINAAFAVSPDWSEIL